MCMCGIIDPLLGGSKLISGSLKVGKDTHETYLLLGSTDFPKI